MAAASSSNVFDEIAPLPGNSLSKRLHYDDVFINHRGPDVKHTLAITIYNSLVDRGLAVFLDSKELELGDFLPAEIEAAMRKASLHIAIFSENYAQSPWCLAELSFMLQTGKTIVPIFYHVQPTDLRWVAAGVGIYANALLKHEVKGRHSMEKLVEWKEALHRVSFISGHIINDNEDEGKLLEDIVEKIALKVKKWPYNTTAFFDYTIGIEEAKHRVIRLLKMDLQHESKRAVVVYGVGGIGKTTLATAVFKSLDLEGYKFCRLDMDQDCSTDHIKQLQQQILQDLFGVKLRIPLRSYVEGQDRLTQAFTESNSPIFMYIDNALKASDLEKLLPKDLSSLPRKTRVLLTTRRLDQTSIFVQKDFERDQFRVDSLSPSDSKNLLYRIALGSANASFPVGIKTLDVDEIVEMCCGIPLVLELVGSRLKNRAINTSAIESLKESLMEGEGEISERVVDVVYNTLDKLCKEAFLDIVCFFNKQFEYIVRCVVGKVQLEALQDAALVKLSVEEHSNYYYSVSIKELGDMFLTVNVHDIISARGKQLSKPHRILDLESLEEAVQDRKKLKKIKGISIASSTVSAAYEIEAKQLDSMHTSLRVLRLHESIKVNGICRRSFESLKYVSIDGVLPMDLKKLKRLAFLCGTVADNVAELPASLRTIILKNSPNLPGLLQCFGNLSSLILVKFTGCDELVTVPTSMGQLKFLTFLDFGGCRNLTALPDTVSDLSGLLRLILSDCSKLACLPPTFGKLKSLCFLDMDGCEAIITLPNSFGKLSALTYLSLNGCSNLLGLPHNFGDLKSLKILNISGCDNLKTLRGDFASLTSLTVMLAWNCQSLHGEAVDILVKMRSLMVIDISGSGMMIERWEVVRQHYPLMVFCGIDQIDGPVHTVEHTLLHSRSRFVGIDSYGQLVEWSWACFKEKVQVAVLLTMCDFSLHSSVHALQRVSEELEKRMMERRGSGKFHIVYVEALEKTEEHIRKTLLLLPSGTCACIPADNRTRQLFNVALYRMLKAKSRSIPIESSHTYIVGLRVGVQRNRKWVKFGTDCFPGDYKEEELERRKNDLQVMTDAGGGLKTLLSHVLILDMR